MKEGKHANESLTILPVDLNTMKSTGVSIDNDLLARIFDPRKKRPHITSNGTTQPFPTCRESSGSHTILPAGAGRQRVAGEHRYC